jgi:hypothetical protein
MQAPSGQMTAPVVQALLKDPALGREWVLDPRKTSIRLKRRAGWGLVPVNGVFREVSGNRGPCAGRRGLRWSCR